MRPLLPTEHTQRRSAHVLLRHTAPATALGFVTPVTLRRGGPRDDPESHVLRIICGVAALADNAQPAAPAPPVPPDWRFTDAVGESARVAARLLMSEELRRMEERQADTVSANMLAECARMVVSRGVVTQVPDDAAA